MHTIAKVTVAGIAGIALTGLSTPALADPPQPKNEKRVGFSCTEDGGRASAVLVFDSNTRRVKRITTQVTATAKGAQPGKAQFRLVRSFGSPDYSTGWHAGTWTVTNPKVGGKPFYLGKYGRTDGIFDASWERGLFDPSCHNRRAV